MNWKRLWWTVSPLVKFFGMLSVVFGVIVFSTYFPKTAVGVFSTFLGLVFGGFAVFAFWTRWQDYEE